MGKPIGTATKGEVEPAAEAGHICEGIVLTIVEDPPYRHDADFCQVACLRLGLS